MNLNIPVRYKFHYETPAGPLDPDWNGLPEIYKQKINNNPELINNREGDLDRINDFGGYREVVFKNITFKNKHLDGYTKTESSYPEDEIIMSLKPNQNGIAAGGRSTRNMRFKRRKSKRSKKSRKNIRSTRRRRYMRSG